MQPSQEAQEPIDSTTPEEAAAAADAAAEALEPVEAGDEGTSSEPYSMADALAEAKAALGLTEAQESAPDNQEAASSEPAEGAEEEPASSPAPTSEEAGRQLLDAAALRRAIEENRLHELPVEYRDALRTVEERYKAQQAEEAEFRRLYLQLEQERIEDPDAFGEKVLEDPRLASFMREYRKAHPDVSLDNPDGVTTADPEKIRASVQAEYVNAFTELAEVLATNAGVQPADFQGIRSKSAGKVGVLLQETFNAAVKAEAARMRPVIQAEERAAAEAEAAAKYAQTRVVTPRQVAGKVAGNAKTPVPTGDTSADWRMAFEEAKQELAGRR